MSEESPPTGSENPLFALHQRRVEEMAIPELKGPQFDGARKLIVDALKTPEPSSPLYIKVRTVFDAYAERLGLPVEELLRMDREEQPKFFALLDQHGLRKIVRAEDL